jgi:hypothetical protein
MTTHIVSMDGYLMSGCMSKMRRQTMIFNRSWNEDEYAYHMRSFVDLFKSDDYVRKLHKWLFE